MDESSSNNRSNSSSDMSSDEKNNFRLIHQLLSTSILKTKQSQHNSILQGSDWMSELLSGHPDRIYNMLRMNKETFQTLCLFLKGRGVLIDSQRTRVSVMESVASFLQTVGLSECQRTSYERFQHSFETISRHIKRVSRALNLLAPELICPPNFNHIHPRIHYNTYFFPYFKDCVGAIDGTLIAASVPVSMQNAYRSRHGDISQNVMAVCDFDLMFTYVMAGWEGKYYLVDSAYPNFSGFLVSYRQDHYHINLFRAGIWCAKEQIPYSERTYGAIQLSHQRDVVIACCVIHNFIRKLGIDDQFFECGERGEFDNPDNEANDQFRRLPQQSQEDIDTQAAFRDAMAAHLWNDPGTDNDNVD
ncbi:UNVERIFIED_CONTAM: hypothetical protein Sindi_1706300 [Sesamum indicum]